MADVNLREYVAKLDDWMQDGSADHVVWHARHILQYYPKNVDAYRYVGQALASLGHLEEASTVLRRVLSVIPDDGKAHAVLSDIYERLNRSNEAIWHMERAYEQDPNDPEIIDQLQRLYREYRHVNNPRLHLTTAAAARQDIRSGAYDRAVNALRGALNRAPQRTDLQLLLAQGLWQRGDLVDAAEVAMDVLRTYPDCMAANQIMAELWLREGRPSDAQRYVNRLESIDPYLALELVQPGISDPNTFRLPELDFDRTTQKEMVGDKLDWLEGIDESDAPEDLTSEEYEVDVDSWLHTGDESEVIQSAETDGGEDEDWMSQLDNIERSYNITTGDFQMTTSPLSEENAFPEATAEDSAAPVELEAAEEPDLSIEWASDATSEAPAVAEDDPFKWLLTEDESDEDAPATIDTADPLAWMRQADIDLPATTELSPEMLQEASDDDDAMSWLRDYNTDVMNDWEDSESAEDQEPALEDLIEPSLEALTFEDAEEFLLDELPFPMDFAEEEGDESLVAEAQPGEPAAPEVTSPLVEAPAAEVAIESPVDEWVASEALLEESFGIEALTESIREAAAEADADDFTFEPQSPLEAPAEVASEAEPYFEAVQAPEQGNIMSDTTPPEYEWLDDDSETSGEPLSTGATGMLDWLSRSESASTDEAEEMAEAVGAEAFQPEDGSTGMTDTLNWMEGNDAAEAEDETPDVETADDESTGSTGMLNWLSQNRPLPPTMPLQPHDVAEQAQSSAQQDDEDWLANLEDQELEIVDEGSTGATGMLDWLGKEATPAEPYQEPAATGELENADEWLAEIMADEETPKDEGVPSAWQPQPEMAADEASIEDLDWLNAESMPEEEVVPDDLTMIEGIEPETAEALFAAGITSFQALADAQEDDLFAALEAQGLSVTVDPLRWATQARFLAEGDIQGFYNFQDSLLEGGQDQIPAAEVASPAESFSVQDEPDTSWLSESEALETAEESPVIAAWLTANMSIEDEEEPAAEPANLDWLSEEEAEAAEAEEIGEEASEEPEWMAATLSLESNEEEDELAVEPADLDWLSEDEEESAEALESGEETSEEPEWMAATMSLEDDEEEPAAEPTSLDWINTAILVEEAAEAEENDEETIEVPEWMTAAAMSLEGDEDEEEPAAEPANLDWLSEDEESAEAEESDEETSEEPEWMAAVMSLEDDEEEEESAAEPADLGWLDEEEATEPAASGEATPEEPEWMTSTMSLEDDEEEPEDLDWFSEDEEAETTEEPAETPDWVTATEALQGTIDDGEAEAWLAEELAAAKDGADWADEELDQPEDAQEAVEAMLLDEGEEEAVPAWMTEEQQPEPVGDTEFDPLMAMETAEEVVEPAYAMDVTDELGSETAEADAWDLEAETYAGTSDEDLSEEPVELEDEPDEYYTAFEDAPEAAEIAPAPNAPDWLNAMVPGLDIDYEAPEDEQLETSFETMDEEELEPAMPEDFGWVNEIVEEETRPEPAIEGVQQRAPRFVFSRPPVWLRRLLDRRPEQPSETDDDLPAWLR